MRTCHAEPPPTRILGLYLKPEQVLFGIGAIARWVTEIPLSWTHEPQARSARAALHDASEYIYSYFIRIVRRLRRRRR